MISTIALALITGIVPVSPEAPNRQPQLAASNGVVALVFGSGHSVMFSQSKDQGKTFSQPAAIADLPVLALGRHRGPRITFAGQTMLVSAIGGATLATGTHAHGLPADGDLFVWRSVDGGRRWSKAATVNDAPGAAREGLHSMAADDKGHVAAVWLDLRSAGTKLYGAFSNDSGATWSKNRLVYESPDSTICQCCHPSLVALGDGEFAVMFRNAVAGSRDMYLARLRDGEVISKPVKAGSGTWEINACPMDGGGIAISSGRTLTAWRRGEEIFLASQSGEETRIGSGKDVALTAQGERVLAVWTEAGRIESWVSGKLEMFSKSGAFPSITSVPEGGFVAAWEDNGSISLRRVE